MEICGGCSLEVHNNENVFLTLDRKTYPRHTAQKHKNNTAKITAKIWI